MKKTGALTVSDGVPRVGGLRLALEEADDPFAAARNFLLDGLELSEGEDVLVKGTRGMVGVIPALFLAEVGFLLKAASGLGGGIITPPGTVKCKADGCGYVNKLHSLLLHNLPDCQNPARPTHTLKVF